MRFSFSEALVVNFPFLEKVTVSQQSHVNVPERMSALRIERCYDVSCVLSNARISISL